MVFLYHMQKYTALFFVSLAFISTNLYVEAQTQAKATSSAPVQAKMVVLANVDLYSPSVVQTAKGEMSVVFVLKTIDREQNNIHYGVSLTNSKGQKVFSYVFKNTINLTKDKPVTVTGSFVPPAGLQGTFSAVIEVTNENGLPLAFGSVQDVKITSSSTPSEAPLVALKKCTTEKEVISNTEPLTITCTFSDTPHTSSMMAVDLYSGNEKVSRNHQDISLQESKGVVTIPPQTASGPYKVTLQAYEGTTPVGETQEVLFGVTGSSAKITSLLTDKAQYEAGDEALVTAGLSIYSDKKVDLFAEVSMTSVKGVACATVSKTPITTMGSVSVSLPITSSCDGYSLKFSIMDGSGAVLDTKTLETQGKERISFSELFGEAGSTTRYVWYGVFLALLVALGMYAYKERRLV